MSPIRGVCHGTAGWRGVFISGCAALAGCVSPEPDAVSRSEAASRGAAVFEANCSTCHGFAGSGGGPVDAPSLVTLASGNGGRFPSEYVVGVVEGHGRNRDFSAVMPEFGGSGMGTGPVVDVAGVDRPVPAPLADLLAYLVTIQD